MLILAASLPPGMAALAFPDHPASKALAVRAIAPGLAAETFDPGDAGPLIGGSSAEIVHVHADIGWEGHGLVAAAAKAAGPSSAQNICHGCKSCSTHHERG